MVEFGPYEVVQYVASGTTAAVYKARHREINRWAAIKELSADLRQTPAALARFRAEAHVLAQFDDPHIVTVYDFVEEPSRVWIAEEWIDGATIEGLLATTGRLTPEQSLGVLRGALTGLAYAHERGVVHGDIALSNIIADVSGTSKLIDFGISAPIGDTGVLGTPAFLSPEAARGQTVSPASDVYSAAAVLYALLAGRPPFAGPDVRAVLEAHVASPPPRLADHGPAMAALIDDSLAKEPERRPPDARALLSRLEEAASERFGPAWLQRASIAGLVSAATGMAATAATTATTTAATLTEPTAAAGPTAFVGATARTGRIAHRGKGLLIGGAAAAVVAAGVLAAVVASSSGGSTRPLAAGPSESDVAVVEPVSSAPAPSTPASTPTLPPLQSLPLHGVYKLELRIVDTNYPGQHVGDKDSAVFRFDLSCARANCRGTIASSSGNTYHAAFDGTTLTASRHSAEVSPCVVSSGPNRGKPAPHTRAKLVYDIDYAFRVVRRAPGPHPAAGTVLELRGRARGVAPRAIILTPKTCQINNSKRRHVVYAGTLTYVKS